MPKILLAGCGFLGGPAADFFYARGWEVTGLTAREESAKRLAGRPWPVRAADIADPRSLEAIALEFDVVIHCASSGRGGVEDYRRVYAEGVRTLAHRWPKAHLIFTSSTSVYAQIDGEIVVETSPTVPSRETGRVLLEAEAATLAQGGSVLRLSGLYGPGRSVLMTRFLGGEARLEAGGGRILNQIHRDDAVAALVCAVESPRGLYNVSDDEPTTQRELYGWLAEYFDRPLPPEGPLDLTRKRAWTSKRVSNGRLRACGWRPDFPSYRTAIPSIAKSLGY